jgi:hypothetical protein
LSILGEADRASVYILDFHPVRDFVGECLRHTAAEAAAVKEFGPDDEQRHRLVVNERDSADR